MQCRAIARRTAFRLSSLINVRGYKKTGGYWSHRACLTQPGRARAREKEGCFEKVTALPTSSHSQRFYYHILYVHDDYIHGYMDVNSSPEPSPVTAVRLETGAGGILGMCVLV